MRPNLPRHLYLKLVAKASDTVRRRLEAANPQQAAQVPTAVKEATPPRAIGAVSGHQKRRDRACAGQVARTTTAASTRIRWPSFAAAGKFDEANASIAALANVPMAIAENMMIESRAEGVMILAKVAGLSWPTVKQIIHMRDELSGGEPTDIMACKDTYERLRPSTAQQVLRFHRMQQNAPAG